MKIQPIIFITLVAIITSSNFCLKARISKGPRQGPRQEEDPNQFEDNRLTKINDEASQSQPAKRQPAKRQLAQNYDLIGRIRKSPLFGRGQIYEQGQDSSWILYTSYGMLSGYYVDKYDWKAFMIAFIPTKTTRWIKGQLYDIKQQIIGKFTLCCFDAPGNSVPVKGKAIIDLGNPVPLNRFTIDKQKLDGVFYQFIANSQYHQGTVSVKKKNDNQYQGRINLKQADQCPYTFKLPKSLVVDQFKVFKPISCKRGSLSPYGFHIQTIKIEETKTSVTYGLILPRRR